MQGRHFELFTDHKPLESLSKIHKKTLNGLQQQMLEYDFKVNYRKGLNNVAVLLHDPMDVFIHQMFDDSGDIVSAQQEDAFVCDVRNFLCDGTLPNHSLGYRSKVEKIGKDCFVDQNIVWITLRRPVRPDNNALLTPVKMRQMVMIAAHCSREGGHSGKQRTVDQLELAYWWPGITYDVDSFISRCVRCQEISGKKPLQSLPVHEEPNSCAHMDLEIDGLMFRET